MSVYWFYPSMWLDAGRAARREAADLDPYSPATIVPMSAPYDSRPETYQHISHVRGYLTRVATDLLRRGHEHDNSKLRHPEVEAFDRCTAKLKSLEYGTKEYEEARAELGEALAHHYSVNDHHPEHFENGIADMNLLQVTELLCDWMAACKRMESGDIRKSIEINQKRFGYSDDFKQLLLNTVPFLEQT